MSQCVQVKRWLPPVTGHHSGRLSHYRYVHDDSETTEDEVHLRVTDGVNAAAVVLLVQVGPSWVQVSLDEF